jgi:hypothetical protein
MSVSVSTTLGRAATSVVDKIRQHVAVRGEILRAAKDRRNLVASSRGRGGNGARCALSRMRE